MSIQHKDIPEAQLHEPKGVSTALSGTVYVADGAGSGQWTAKNASNETIINFITDFPAPVAGVITLLPDTRYVIASSISSPDRFVLGNNTQVTSFSTLSPVFEYTGTGSMLSGVDATVLIQDIRLNAPSGEVFNFKDVAVPNTNIAFIKDCIVNNCAKLGTFDSMVSLVITDVPCFNATQGYTLAGSGWRVWRVQDVGIISTNAAMVGFDLGTASTNAALFDAQLFTFVAGAVAFNGAANSANITSGNLGRIKGINLTNDGTPITGLTTDDVRWVFSDNDELKDTKQEAFITMSGNTTETAISGIGTKVLVAGTWVEQEISQFTSTAAGRLTYMGERAVNDPIIISASSVMASGTDTHISYCLYKNGAEVVGSGQPDTIRSGRTGNTSIIWQDTIEQGDYFELYVANLENTTNIIVQDVKFLIN